MAVKTGYKHGIATLNSTNPTGDNYMANFIRGAVLYMTDEQARALRTEKISRDKEDARAYLLEVCAK